VLTPNQVFVVLSFKFYRITYSPPPLGALNTSEEEDFNFQDILGQELSKAEKEELKEYAISCGYRPGALLFGGVNEESLGCLQDHTWAKDVGILSKSVGLPKVEADLSRYRRQHSAGSLFYANFKVKFLTFYCFDMKIIFWWSLFYQGLLLRKVLRIQQDLEDKKNEIIIEGLEKKIKDHEATLEKKDFVLQTMEGSLAEAQAEIARLNSELSMQNKNFEAKLEAEAEKNSILRKSLKELQEKWVNFGNQCRQRLKQDFNSVGASAEKFSPSVENLPETFEHIEGEVDALDEVIDGHADFCALLASRGTAVAFMKSGCTHGNIVNRPNFSLSLWRNRPNYSKLSA
jgi:hypothetical protein